MKHKKPKLNKPRNPVAANIQVRHQVHKDKKRVLPRKTKHKGSRNSSGYHFNLAA